jgi:hypothetical protein
MHIFLTHLSAGFSFICTDKGGEACKVLYQRLLIIVKQPSLPCPLDDAFSVQHVTSILTQGLQGQVMLIGELPRPQAGHSQPVCNGGIVGITVGF